MCGRNESYEQMSRESEKSGQRAKLSHNHFRSILICNIGNIDSIRQHAVNCVECYCKFPVGVYSFNSRAYGFFPVIPLDSNNSRSDNVTGISRNVRLVSFNYCRCAHRNFFQPQTNISDTYLHSEKVYSNPSVSYGLRMEFRFRNRVTNHCGRREQNNILEPPSGTQKFIRSFLVHEYVRSSTLWS